MTVLSRRIAAMLAASFAMLALAQRATADDAHAAKAPRTGHHPAYSRPYGYGPAHPPATDRPAPGGLAEPSPFIPDCVHVTFPQCSEGG
jgi:hypothetical protein